MIWNNKENPPPRGEGGRGKKISRRPSYPSTPTLSPKGRGGITFDKPPSLWKETDMTKTRAGSLIFLVVGIYALIFSSRLPLGQWNAPGAGVLPFFLAIALCVSGISWFIAGKPKKEEKAGIDWGGIYHLVKVPFQIVVLTGALVLMLTRVGFLLGATILSVYHLYLGFAFQVASRHRPCHCPRNRLLALLCKASFDPAAGDGGLDFIRTHRTF